MPICVSAQTDFNTKTLEAGDEHVGAGHLAHGVVAEYVQLPRVQRVVYVSVGVRVCRSRHLLKWKNDEEFDDDLMSGKHVQVDGLNLSLEYAKCTATYGSDAQGGSAISERRDESVNRHVAVCAINRHHRGGSTNSDLGGSTPDTCTVPWLLQIQIFRGVAGRSRTASNGRAREKRPRRGHPLFDNTHSVGARPPPAPIAAVHDRATTEP